MREGGRLNKKRERGLRREEKWRNKRGRETTKGEPDRANEERARTPTTSGLNWVEEKSQQIISSLIRVLEH